MSELHEVIDTIATQVKIDAQDQIAEELPIVTGIDAAQHPANVPICLGAREDRNTIATLAGEISRLHSDIGTSPGKPSDPCLFQIIRSKDTLREGKQEG